MCVPIDTHVYIRIYARQAGRRLRKNLPSGRAAQPQGLGIPGRKKFKGVTGTGLFSLLFEGFFFGVLFCFFFRGGGGEGTGNRRETCFAWGGAPTGQLLFRRGPLKHTQTRRYQIEFEATCIPKPPKVELNVGELFGLVVSQ